MTCARPAAAKRIPLDLASLQIVAHPAPADPVEVKVLAKNDALAERNRTWLAQRRILALNLMSSPGAGKTSLLVRTLCDLGEGGRVVLLSTTEGEDKPEKYPHMFRAAHLVLVTKIDLAPHVDFDGDRAASAIRSVNPDAAILEVSAKTGQGLEQWYRWIRARH
jgi:Ni2+-binding GTPase involved in maturation of urease and hydrogenase